LKQYLLDTNIIIYFLKGMYNLNQKIEQVGLENCFVSEITIAELFYGAEKSNKRDANVLVVEEIVRNVAVLPLTNALQLYAKEKVRLQKLGTPVDDFDLLIAATALANQLILVTNNLKHFERITPLELEDWTKQL